MEWLSSLGSAIDYIEEHLLDENLCADIVAEEIAVSSFYFQKGFTILTGYGVAEYIRNRRLYIAAVEIAAGAKVTDMAFKYGWETCESFSKAFSRFHGTTPQSVKGDISRIRLFLPLKIQVTVNGGNRMDYKVEKMDGFKIIGIRRTFNSENSYQEIPKFWDEIYKKYYLTFCSKPEYKDGVPTDSIEKAFKENNIGEYGVCVEPLDRHGNFDYFIAGIYKGGEVPAGLEVYEIPALEWAKFECTGPMPGALQSVNTEIFRSWLPANGKYEIAAGFNIEWYSDGGTPDDDNYKSAIWIPVKEKDK